MQGHQGSNGNTLPINIHQQYSAFIHACEKAQPLAMAVPHLFWNSNTARFTTKRDDISKPYR